MQVEPLVPKKHFRWFLIGAAAILLVGLAVTMLKSVDFGSIKIFGKASVASNCADLPEQFLHYYLPNQTGCWRLKLSEKFSGWVYLPPNGLNFTLDLEEPDAKAEMKSHLSSKTIHFDQNTALDIGNVWRSGRASAFRFRGKGTLRIYLQPKS